MEIMSGGLSRQVSLIAGQNRRDPDQVAVLGHHARDHRRKQAVRSLSVALVEPIVDSGVERCVLESPERRVHVKGPVPPGGASEAVLIEHAYDCHHR